MPRDFKLFWDIFAPRARPILALPRFATLLRDARAFERDFADASTGSMGRSDKTRVRLKRAASFLSLERFTNIILNLVLRGLCDYPMRALLARLCTRGNKRAFLKGRRDTSGFDIAPKVPNQCCESGATAVHPSD